MNVRENPAHASRPCRSDDGELVLLRPSQRFIAGRELVPFLLFEGAVFALDGGAGIGVVRLVEGDAGFVGGDDARADGDGGDEEEFDGGGEGAEGGPGTVESVGARGGNG